MQSGLSACTSGVSNSSEKPSGTKASKPPLGWNSFDSYGVYLHEQAAIDNLKAMAEKLKPHGYEYFVIDGGWYGEFELMEGTLYPKERHANKLNFNEYGVWQPSQTYFPNGFDALMKLAKELDIKMGIHLMRGIPREVVNRNLPIKNSNYRAADVADKNRTCTWNQQNYGINSRHSGAQDWYDSVIRQMDEWGFDFIKYDDLTPYPDEIMLIARAIEKVNPNIVLSLSPGDVWLMHDLPYYQRAQLLRTTGDIWDRQEDIDKSFDAWKKFQGMAKPGFWPDLDMIPFGKLQLMAPDWAEATGETIALAGLGTTRWSRFTPEQMRTFITMRALAASPLFIGGDLISLDEYSQTLITHPEMLACNQNGVCGFNTWDDNGIEIWVTPDKEQVGKGWMGVFNRTGQDREVVLTRENTGMMHFVTGYKLVPNENDVQLKDIWTDDVVLWNNPDLRVSIPSNDVSFFTYHMQ
jgi:alpha-galactosidase